MRTERSLVALDPRSALVLAATAALALARPAVASPPAQTDAASTPRYIVLLPAPPPARGWDAPEPMAVELVGVDPSQVVVYSLPPEPRPCQEKLAGVDIRTHRFAEEPGPSHIPTLIWESGRRTQILSDDWSTGRGGVPTAGTGRALATQSWNPSGEHYAPSRIRTDDWRTRVASGRD